MGLFCRYCLPVSPPVPALVQDTPLQFILYLRWDKSMPPPALQNQVWSLLKHFCRKFSKLNEFKFKLKKSFLMVHSASVTSGTSFVLEKSRRRLVKKKAFRLQSALLTQRVHSRTTQNHDTGDCRVVTRLGKIAVTAAQSQQQPSIVTDVNDVDYLKWVSTLGSGNQVSLLSSFP